MRMLKGVRIENADASASHSLTQAEQRELQGRMERKQMKDFMNVSSFYSPSPSPAPNLYLSLLQMYSNLVQRCFNDCVNDFTSKSLLGKEESCVMRCVDKFLKSSERLGERFQEQNAQMAQQGNMMGGR